MEVNGILRAKENLNEESSDFSDKIFFPAD